MRVIGLTGGVASGKTEAARVLAARGFPVIDTDAIARSVLARDPRARKAVRDAFGTTDRRKLRKLVFADRRKRRRLESILHPKIAARVDAKLASLRTRSSPPPAAIVVVPLLFEAGWEKRMDSVVAVVCRKSTQMERLKKRDGTSVRLARRMIASQLANSVKARRADVVIRNEGKLSDFRRRVAELADQFPPASGRCALRSRARGRPGAGSTRTPSRAGSRAEATR